MQRENLHFIWKNSLVSFMHCKGNDSPNINAKVDKFSYIKSLVKHNMVGYKPYRKDIIKHKEANILLTSYQTKSNS